MYARKQPLPLCVLCAHHSPPDAGKIRQVIHVFTDGLSGWILQDLIFEVMKERKKDR